jgi:hypothetical protein
VAVAGGACGVFVAVAWGTAVGSSPPQAAINRGASKPISNIKRPNRGLEILNEFVNLETRCMELLLTKHGSKWNPGWVPV